MKTLIIASMLALVAGNAVAGVAPGCIGGCMGTAPNVGNVTLPAGYQCVTGWPNWSPVSCVADDINSPAPSIQTTIHRNKNGTVTVSTEKTK